MTDSTVTGRAIERGLLNPDGSAKNLREGLIAVTVVQVRIGRDEVETAVTIHHATDFYGPTSGHARVAAIQRARGDAASAVQRDQRELLGDGEPVTWTRAALRQALDREHQAWREDAIQDLEPGQ